MLPDQTKQDVLLIKSQYQQNSRHGVGNIQAYISEKEIT